MTITFFSPYGPLNKESGFMYMIARYIGASYGDVCQLKCNGLFTMCNRDCMVSLKRNFLTCGSCMASQDALSSWACIAKDDLSKYLYAKDLKYIKQELLLVPDNELTNVFYEDLNIYNLCKDSFSDFLGESTPDINNKKNLQLIKKIMLSSIKAIQAIKIYYDTINPKLFFISSGNDFITKSFLEFLKITHKNSIVVSWNNDTNMFHIVNLNSGECKRYEIYIENIVCFRNDYTTWPEEFLNMLNDITDFIKLTRTDQMEFNFVV